MADFHSLFGVEPDQLKKICIISPFLNKDILSALRIEELRRGGLYSVGNSSSHFSYVVSKMGPLFIGDAVLYLKNTPVENLIFFGSCGATKETGFEKGQLCLVEKVFSQDSFVNTLMGEKCHLSYSPCGTLYQSFTLYKEEYSLKKVTCLSIGSLKLEQRYLQSIQSDLYNIEVIDMETSAFYAASLYIKKNALAFLFVSDILDTFPFYEALKKENQKLFKNSVVNSAKVLLKLIEKIR